MALLRWAVAMSPARRPAHPCGDASGTSSRDTWGELSIISHQPLCGQVTGQQENGSWQESSSDDQSSLYLFLSSN